uniref:Uncharacterized protein n=1 Tax=Melopsittacus undulatus TaxID=13146 RepID=A0A8C6IXT6_MELUD
MRRMRAVEGRWSCSVSSRRGRPGSGGGAGGLGGQGGRQEGRQEGCQEGWRGQSRGSVQQLAERFADLAASYSEALLQRAEQEAQNARLRQDNSRLRAENRRLRRENRCLFRQTLLVPDKPAAAVEEEESLRTELERLRERHRRALQHLSSPTSYGSPLFSLSRPQSPWRLSKDGRGCFLVVYIC